MAEAKAAIEVESLSKTYRVHERSAGLAAALRSVFRRRYKVVHAVEALSFSIAPGERVGFLGPNGAGKTTTLKVLSGLLHATSGSVRVSGFVPHRREAEFLKRITLVMGQKQQLLWDLSLGLLVTATLVLYSICILVISAAFWVVRLDNLAYLFNSLFDFARWPVTIFSGFWRIAFTVIIPLALMTTYPAEAMLGTLAGSTAATAALGALAFSVIARAVWKRAIGPYTSASS